MPPSRILNPWVDDPIGTLVANRFPLVFARLRGDAAESEPVEGLAESARLYRAELMSLTREQLAERVAEGQRLQREAQVRIAEHAESERFFHQPGATMDVAHWSRMSYWTLDEALALSFGKEPRVVTWPRVQREIFNSPFAKTFSERREIIARARAAGQLFDSTLPGVFLAWAQRMHIPVPQPLIEAVLALGIQIRDWKAAYEEQKAVLDDVSEQLTRARAEHLQSLDEHSKYIDELAAGYKKIIDNRVAISNADKATIQKLIAQLESAPAAPVASAGPAEKPLGTRERESLLKLLIGMAIKAYIYDPKALRNGATREIASDLATLGVPLDEDTIRKYLTEAKSLLPPSETE